MDERAFVPIYIAVPDFEGDIREDSLRVDARVDTGADMSAIPQQLLEKIIGDQPIDYYGSIAVETFDGKRSYIKTVLLTIALEIRGNLLVYDNVELLIIDNQDFLIGMDILSTLWGKTKAEP